MNKITVIIIMPDHRLFPRNFYSVPRIGEIILLTPKAGASQLTLFVNMITHDCSNGQVFLNVSEYKPSV